MDSAYRQLPSVDRVLAHPVVVAQRQRYPHQLVADLVRRELDAVRQRIAQGEAAPGLEAVASAVVAAIGALEQAGPRAVINATGVIIHTNLGRAPLSDEALAAMAAVAAGYSDLEFDIESGERGHRYVHIEPLLCQLSGAEAAFAVNNNASAVLVGLMALCQGREVIVSRGQAVEIGGGFRIPEVMAQSGARLVEVGTTNRTYLADYEAAITSQTAALLRVHTSNFRVIGFTHAVPLAEMAELARRYGLLLLDDIGSGCLLDTTAYGLAPEPTVQASIADGADLVFFSGDKLLGGPQAGIIVGRREPMERLRRHPLARAVRIDKLTLAALAATLRHYLRGEATARIPVWQMISATTAEVEARARAWADALGNVASVAAGRSMVGGGSLPEESLPTTLLVVVATGDRRLSVEALAARLRRLDPPIVARIEADAVVLDPRTVLPRDDATVLAALGGALDA